MKILGLHKDPWHDTGAAIIKKENNKTLFVNLTEERCNREKDSRKFPHNAVLTCMKEMGIKSYDEFDLVVMDYIVDGKDWRNDFNKVKCNTDNFLNTIDPSKIRIINHHMAHAYNVFYSSGFDKAAILMEEDLTKRHKVYS
jgi:carbamoyltransferase